MRHMALKIAIGNVSEIAHDNLRILERRLHVNFLVVTRNRVDRHRIRERVWHRDLRGWDIREKVIKKCNILQISIDKSGKIIYFNTKTAIYCQFLKYFVLN